MLRRLRLDVMQPCLSPGTFVLGLLAGLPRKNCRTIDEQGRLCLPVVDLGSCLFWPLRLDEREEYPVDDLDQGVVGHRRLVYEQLVAY